MSHPRRLGIVLHKHLQLLRHLTSPTAALSTPPGAVLGPKYLKSCLPLVDSVPSASQAPYYLAQKQQAINFWKVPKSHGICSEGPDWLRWASQRNPPHQVKGLKEQRQPVCQPTPPPPSHPAGCAPKLRSPQLPSADSSPATPNPKEGRRGALREKQPPTWVSLSLLTRTTMVQELSWGDDIHPRALGSAQVGNAGSLPSSESARPALEPV